MPLKASRNLILDTTKLYDLIDKLTVDNTSANKRTIDKMIVKKITV